MTKKFCSLLSVPKNFNHNMMFYGFVRIRIANQFDVCKAVYARFIYCKEICLFASCEPTSHKEENRRINPRFCFMPSNIALPYFCTYSILIMFKVFHSSRSSDCNLNLLAQQRHSLVKDFCTLICKIHFMLISFIQSAYTFLQRRW